MGKFLAIYETRNFIDVLKTARHISVPCSFISLAYLFKVYFYPFIISIPRSSKWSLSFRFPNQNLVSISFSPKISTCHHHLIFFLIALITFCEKYQSLDCMYCCNSFFYSVTFFQTSLSLFISIAKIHAATSCRLQLFVQTTRSTRMPEKLPRWYGELLLRCLCSSLQTTSNLGFCTCR